MLPCSESSGCGDAECMYAWLSTADEVIELLPVCRSIHVYQVPMRQRVLYLWTIHQMYHLSCEQYSIILETINFIISLNFINST